MKEIEGRKDVELLVDRFYEKAFKDKVIGHFFTQVVPLDLNHHIPILYDFWESTLFDLAK